MISGAAATAALAPALIAADVRNGAADAAIGRSAVKPPARCPGDFRMEAVEGQMEDLVVEDEVFGSRIEMLLHRSNHRLLLLRGHRRLHLRGSTNDRLRDGRVHSDAQFDVLVDRVVDVGVENDWGPEDKGQDILLANYFSYNLRVARDRQF
jgi:hypothetical protein